MTNSQDDTARWDAGIEKPSPETHEITATHTEDNRDHVGQMDDLDLRNTRAYKSDDSDGKVEFSWRNLIAAISLAGCYAAAQLPSQLMGSSLSYAAVDLGSTNISWLSTANTLGIAALSPFVGYLTDLVGRRYIGLFGSACIIVGAILTGTAHTFGQAVTGMSIAGCGGSICELNALAGIAQIAPVRLRGVYVGFVTAAIIPFTPYLIYTELLCNNATWRWNMWITVIWCGTFTLGVIFFYFPPPVHRTEGIKKIDLLKRLDYIGGALSVISITLVLTALQDGGNRYPWKSAHVLVTLLVGVACIVGLVVWEGWLAPHPMMPPILFKTNRAVPLALFVAFAAGLSLYSIFAFYPLMLQSLYINETPLQIGTRGLGYGISITFAAVTTNVALSYTKGHVREPLLLATLFMMAFTGSLAKANPTNANYTTVMGMLAGLGVGGLITPAATVAMMCCPDAAISTITGISLAVRTLGGSVGVSIYSAIYSNKIGQYLVTDISERVVEAGLPATAVPDFLAAYLTPGQNASLIEGVTPFVLEQAAIGRAWANAHAISFVWYASVAFAAISVVCCAFLPNIRQQMTNRVAVAFH